LIKWLIQKLQARELRPPLLSFLGAKELREEQNQFQVAHSVRNTAEVKENKYCSYVIS
jgi:hypothetical protein